MNIIDSETSRKVAERFNDKDNRDRYVGGLLKYYAGVSTSHYLGTPEITLVNNKGIRIEVDDTPLDIFYPPKINWKMSEVNRNTDAKERGDLAGHWQRPISELVIDHIKTMVHDAETLTGFGTVTNPVPEWKTLTKQSYHNGYRNEKINRYNAHPGSLSKRSDSSLRPHAQ